mmetsp:Transcript_110555/g.311800  ORF Transcript_110555/g.311800 Transcript_110555/m.311800 type:complete len:336 (+) Transcript_110555:286-1293(+)
MIGAKLVLPHQVFKPRGGSFQCLAVAFRLLQRSLGLETRPRQIQVLHDSLRGALLGEHVLDRNLFERPRMPCKARIEHEGPRAANARRCFQYGYGTPTSVSGHVSAEHGANVLASASIETGRVDGEFSYLTWGVLRRRVHVAPAALPRSAGGSPFPQRATELGARPVGQIELGNDSRRPPLLFLLQLRERLLQLLLLCGKAWLQLADARLGLGEIHLEPRKMRLEGLRPRLANTDLLPNAVGEQERRQTLRHEAPLPVARASRTKARGGPLVRTVAAITRAIVHQRGRNDLGDAAMIRAIVASLGARGGAGLVTLASVDTAARAVAEVVVHRGHG